MFRKIDLALERGLFVPGVRGFFGRDRVCLGLENFPCFITFFNRWRLMVMSHFGWSSTVICYLSVLSSVG